MYWICFMLVIHCMWRKNREKSMTMNRWRAVLVLVFAVFGSYCHQAPASTKHYEIGSLYTYDYSLGLELSEPTSYGNKTEGSTVGYKILSTVHIQPVWQQSASNLLLEVKLVKPHLQIRSRIAPNPDGFRDHTSQLDTVVDFPFYFHVKDGQVQSTYTAVEDNVSIANIKKGIATLLQISSHSGSIPESSPLGQCTVTYQTDSRSNGYKKEISNCSSHHAQTKFPFSTHRNRVLGSTHESQVYVELETTGDSFVVDTVTVHEKHSVRVSSKKEVGAQITGTQVLKLTGATTGSGSSVTANNVDDAVKELGRLHRILFKEGDLTPENENIPFCEGSNCKKLEKLIQSLTPEDIASTKMASAFIQVISKFREFSESEIKNVLKPSVRVLSQLLDACAAAGTVSAHKAAMSVLNFQSEDNIEHPERYLLALSLAPTTKPDILNDIFDLAKSKVKSEKLQETLWLTTAALVHTLRATESIKENPSTPPEMIGSHVEDFILESLSSCKSIPCEETFIRSLKNLKSSKTVNILIEKAQNKNPRVSVSAMKALHAMPDTFIQSTHRPILMNIATQLTHNFDSSARTLAVDMLLRNEPTKREISRLISTLQKKVIDKQHSEVSTFMWNRLHEFAESNPLLRVMLQEVIVEEDIMNYHYLSPAGQSTAFTRHMYSNPSSNGSFSNAIEMTGKLLKRSLFDAIIKNDESSLPLLSLGIFAGGLSSFASSDDTSVPASTPEVEEEDATAGMELSLLGVQMRPIIFFSSKGELMGLVWSGTGSERTTAVQGNVLLHDEKKSIPLYNGLLAQVNVLGGLSFDLAGQVQLSLWYKTANSLVENKASLMLQSVVRVDTSFVRSRVDYTVASDAALHFTSDINFSDGVLMCLKLTQPGFNLKQNIHKTERIPGSKHRLRKAKYMTIPIPGVTYALNKKNSDLCRVMYKDEL